MKSLPSIKQLRLMNALTIQEVSIAIGLPISTLKRYESGGVGKVSAFRVSILLVIYGSDWDSFQFDKIPTKKELVEAILTGSASVDSDGTVSVDLITMVTLLKAEGFPTSELENLLDDKKNASPQERIRRIR